MTTHDYQYDINTILSKEENGLVSSFVLQLDSLLSENDITTQTEQKLLDVLVGFLHDLTGGKASSDDLYVEGYQEGYSDARQGYSSEY